MSQEESHFLSDILGGVFQTMVEIQPPLLQEVPSEEAQRQMSMLGAEYALEGGICAAVMLDRFDGALRHDPAALCGVFAENFGGPVVRMLSGKGRSLPDVQDALLAGAANQQRLFCMATGDLDITTGIYTDSAVALKLASSRVPELVTGAVINFDKYTAQDMALAYGKIARKLQLGAKFLLAQASWDMKKAQEFQWVMQLRDSMMPVVARVLWFSAEELSQRTPKTMAGIHIPELYLRKLKAAYQQDESAGRAFQAQAVAMLMTGFRRLGFSGVLLAGGHASADRAALRGAFRETQERLPDFDAWLTEWKRDYALDMCPPVRAPRYLFAGLLQEGRRDPERLDYDPTSVLEMEKPSGMDFLRARLVRYAARPGTPEFLRNTLCALCGTRPSELVSLETLEYLPNGGCPKRLTEGPCGNVAPDGLCECGAKPCFFHRVLTLKQRG